ncbi:hypothetical protein H0H81_000872 [Sphagnurus paluster]|uniref:Uncharacterized protein n=1 Tax=Sphagnurus paluster TaxID=117069 RepID=A0A9P7KNA9_9AGAR|nr:hypothetical protein H0H81_000872 [Sphagnurus paluster]
MGNPFAIPSAHTSTDIPTTSISAPFTTSLVEWIKARAPRFTAGTRPPAGAEQSLDSSLEVPSRSSTLVEDPPPKMLSWRHSLLGRWFGSKDAAVAAGDTPVATVFIHESGGSTESLEMDITLMHTTSDASLA